MRYRKPSPSGFSLIELMITVAIVAILAQIALPSYASYIKRSKVPPGLDALSAYAVRMEQYYQDNAGYGTGSTCGVSLPTGVSNFSISCTVPGAGRYTATATGTGPLDGYAYTIDQSGTRRTTGHPNGVPSGNCWSIRGASCDS